MANRRDPFSDIIERADSTAFAAQVLAELFGTEFNRPIRAFLTRTSPSPVKRVRGRMNRPTAATRNALRAVLDKI